MKKTNHSINDNTDIAIILSYAFFVLGKTLSRSQMNEIVQTDGSILALTETMKQYKEKILSITTNELWNSVIDCLDSSRMNKREGVIFPYNDLDEEQLFTIIKASESQLSQPFSLTFPFETLFDEMPIKDSNRKIIIGYEIPVIAQYLSSSNIELDVIVFESTEYVVAKIQSELLDLSRMKVYKIESEKQLKRLLEHSNSTVFINELSRETQSSPLLDLFYAFNMKDFGGEKLPLSWLMLHSLLNHFNHDRVISLMDERDLRHRRFMNFRERLVKEKLVEFVVSVQGNRHSNFNFISLNRSSNIIMMKSINYDGQHILVEDELVDQEKIKKTKFYILSPFDYTFTNLLENVFDLASETQIFSGYQVGLRRLKEMEDKDKQVEVRMVSMPHLNKFEVLTPKDEYVIQVGRNALSRFEILENDILIASKSNDPKPTIVKNKPNDQLWIANSSLIVIRTKFQSKFTPEYLFAFLASERGLNQLKRLQRGSIVFITTNQISDLLVEKTDSGERDRITRSVIEIINHHQQLSKELKQLELQFERVII